MKKIIRGMLVLFIMGFPYLLVAQFSEPPGVGDGQVYDVEVPFDSWVYLLVTIGIGYGLFRAWIFRKNEKMKKKLLHD
jgi:hypothetical protein